MGTFGEPTPLREDVLPTELDLYNHYLHLNNVKSASGDWKKCTLLCAKVKCVAEDLGEIWGRTGIPHCLNNREGERRIQNIILKCRKLNKVAMDRRGESFGKDLQALFDVSLCHHQVEESCTCPVENKVKQFEIEN